MSRFTALDIEKAQRKALGLQEPKPSGRKKPGAASGGPQAIALTAEQKEIVRLRAEVAKLRVERDVAKQAATSFARYLQRRIGG